MIYLNHHKKTRVCQSCLEILQQEPWLEPCDLEKSYQTIYDFLGISYEDQFIACSSWEKGIDDVLYQVYLQQVRKEGKTHIIAFNLDGTPIRSSLKKLEELGVIVHVIEMDKDGIVDLSSLKKAISVRTALICCSWANGFNGVVQPIETIEQIAKEKNIQLYVDVSYVLGKVYLPLNDRSIDYVTFSAHVIHAFEHSAGIVALQKRPFPLIKKTMDSTLLKGLAIACQQSLLFIDQMGLVVAQHRNLLEQKLLDASLSVRIYGQNTKRLGNVSCLSFAKVHSEPLWYRLEQKGIFSEIFDEQFISLSLSRYTTKQEIEQAIDRITKEVRSLQTLSVDL